MKSAYPSGKYLIPAIAFALLLVLHLPVTAQGDDSYTRYELLDPASQRFRILYEVTVTQPGAAYYFNTLRKGSAHQVDAVIDRMTGKPLTWTIVNGVQARKAGHTSAAEDTDYLQVTLARPVTPASEYRLLIDKTYQDASSYFSKDGLIVFDRPLGIKRNAVVLPAGYEIVRCNYPVQVLMEADGRINLSFLNTGPAEVPLHMEARKLPATANLKPSPKSAAVAAIPGEGRDKSRARVEYVVQERARQTREIVYFLQQPETHAFRLYHDYTETRPGMDRYLNVVRAGSKASNPSARILDTGKELKVETLKGDAITQRGLDIGEPVTGESEVVVIWFDPVVAGQSLRLRIEETYTDPNRYVLHNDELVFDRAFGRPFNTVILPEGWFLTANAIPATIDLTNDNKISLTYVNGDPDEIDVLIKARRK
ncbi:MAG: hypothetical protein JNN04_04940 [Cyclobacteriaceae bacterium]|nr:hypothetical protein [Cyclobacteriaceae bacterium]